MCDRSGDIGAHIGGNSSVFHKSNRESCFGVFSVIMSEEEDSLEVSSEEQTAFAQYQEDHNYVDRACSYGMFRLCLVGREIRMEAFLPVFMKQLFMDTYGQDFETAARELRNAGFFDSQVLGDSDVAVLTHMMNLGSFHVAQTKQGEQNKIVYSVEVTFIAFLASGGSFLPPPAF